MTEPTTPSQPSDGKPGSDPADDIGGSPACMAHLVCPRCGRLDDTFANPTVCASCGELFSDDD